MKHAISTLYTMVIELKAPQNPGFIQTCEREMGVTFSEAQKNKIFRFTHKVSIAMRYQKGSY